MLAGLLNSCRYQKVIADITRRMGHGMAEFSQRRIVTIENCDLYCHYVAGLVGIGLSELFAASGLEGKSIGRAEYDWRLTRVYLQRFELSSKV